MQSLSEAHLRWDSRKRWSFRIGHPKYAMAEYDKITRLTLPLGENGIIMISAEPSIDAFNLVKNIQDVRKKFFD